VTGIVGIAFDSIPAICQRGRPIRKCSLFQHGCIAMMPPIKPPKASTATQEANINALQPKRLYQRVILFLQSHLPPEVLCTRNASIVDGKVLSKPQRRCQCP
jgi:hypothetical protein